MADQNTHLRHIKIDGYSQTGKYISPRTARSKPPQERNRSTHGNRIKGQLDEIKLQFEALKNVELPEGIIRDDAIYVEFISDFNFELAFDSLHTDTKNPKYQLLSIKTETIESQKRFRVNVMLTEGGISHFISRVEQYLASTTTKPRHEKLISNIEIIQLATLEAFWSEPDQNPFPNEYEVVWWEVWFRKKEGVEFFLEQAKIEKQLELIDAQVGDQQLEFPEHYIRLVKASARQLSNSIFLLDNLAELRKPKETADFFTNLTITEREEWIDEFQGRIINQTDDNSIVVCLLDTGVQNQHPLLTEFIPANNLFSYKLEDWGTFDGAANGGHGTGMAGLALYGDLTTALATTSNIEVFHRLESVKLINSSDPHDPKLYGAVTIESANTPIISFPERTRIYCMAISSEDQAYLGRPSSWSAAVDKIIVGNEAEELERQLFLVSGGNIVIETPNEYGDKNILETIHDPAQAFNSITVGAYTEMDTFSEEEFPNSEILAPKGGMAPANSTSVIWENNWAVKPDLVMEGGNLINQDNDIVAPDSLQLLTTHKDYRVKLLQPFGDTSGATALASNFAIQIKNVYPNYNPETVRALMIHSCDWTDTMLQDRSLSALDSMGQMEKRTLLRTFGYGVPNLQKALHSAKNSLTLIAEKQIKPYKKEGSSIKFDEIHFFELPWPIEVLQENLAAIDVKLNITLSYFIEPNPGNRKYSNKFSYQSHGLRFSVIKPDENFEDFQKRINKNAREDDETSGFTGERWLIGSQLRDKGSIHRDFFISSGADLATRNRIAVYPVSGWYRTRKKLEKYDSTVKYSLIVSIESPETDIDIYTPVLNEITIEI